MLLVLLEWNDDQDETTLSQPPSLHHVFGLKAFAYPLLVRNMGRGGVKVARVPGAESIWE